MELNAVTVDDGFTLSADTCIVGAGPTGLALAHELSGHCGETVVLESGGSDHKAALTDLNAGDVTGAPYQVLSESRCRGIGGTAAVWNTVLNGSMTAKYVELDPIDFEPRDWVEHSGWPFPKTVLDPYYRKARELAESVCMKACKGSCDVIMFADGGLVNRYYHFGTPETFLQRIPEQLRAASDVTLIRGATVTRILTAARNDRVREMHWKTLSGNSGVIQASNFVLAAGGIENARLLLIADKLGSRQSEWLGGGFMEHPVDVSLELTSDLPELASGGGFYAPHGNAGGKCIMGRVGVSEALMREERLANASLRLIADAVPQSSLGRSLGAVTRRVMPFKSLHQWAGHAVRSIGGVTRTAGPAPYRVLLDLEQAPHMENRIVLTDRADRLGCPRVALHWRWRNDDERARQRILSVVVREMKRSGVGKLRVMPARALDANTHHHAGATRMHTDPDEGVVDEQLRVHGVENLFVTGSSVFPTAGFANPTLTSIALTLRLADHLRKLT